VSDGAGGAIIVWRDVRSGVQGDVYAQRLTTDGSVSPGWPANGIALESLATTVLTPVAVSDGASGAIAVWRDGRGGLYAQRINGAGTTQWTANGVRLAFASVTNFEVIADGAGGAIAAWEDARAGGANKDIYARRISATGDTLWTGNGKAVCTFTGNQVFPTLATDGAGGAIIAWVDERNGASACRLFAQRITGAGAESWTVNGIQEGGSGNVFNDEDLGAAPDESGGAYLAWTEFRTGQYRVFLQHVNSAGAVVAGWNAAGLEVPTGVVDAEPVVISDGSGSCILATSIFGIEAVQLDKTASNGAHLWTQTVSMVNGTDGPEVVSDGGGGAYTAFLYGFNSEVHASQVAAGGSIPAPWPPGGLSICSTTGTRLEVAMAGTSDADAIVAWTDSRNQATTNSDIYATKLVGGSFVGIDPLQESALALERPFPNPSRGPLSVRFVLPGSAPATIEIVDVRGRRILQRDVSGLGAGRHTMVLDEDAKFGVGIYYLKLHYGRTERATRFAIVR
jgi:hypothetical protein